MYRPEQNWLPASSFVEPVEPPGVEPTAAPLVCAPINTTWVPYVLGAIQQLCQPTTWATSDPTVLQTTLDQAQELLEAIGGADFCMQIRWNDGNCSVQISTDGGATWANIPGWPDPGPPDCLHPMLRVDSGGNLQITYDGGTTWTTVDGWPPPTPPNPSGASTAQAACNVATHLAQDIIQGALAAAVNAFDGSLSAAVAASSIIALIPGFGPEVALTIDAAVGIVYLIYTTGSIGDYRTASTDPLLAHDLQCAIYNAIVLDGEVTAANYAAVVAAVAAIGYTPSDVQSAINTFVSQLGLNGLLAAQQLGGLIAGDCSGCVAEGVALFNGTDDYLSAAVALGNPPALPLTICFWYASGSATLGTDEVWVSDITSDHTLGNLKLYFEYDSAGALIQNQWRDTSTTRAQENDTATPANSHWHHLAFVYETAWSGGTYIPYVDGVSVGTSGVSTPGNWSGIADTGTTIGNTLPATSPPGAQWYNGKMADLRWYAAALTATQIADIYAAGVTGYLPVGSPTHWYKFDEGSGTTAHDSGSGHDDLTWHGSGSHWSTV